MQREVIKTILDLMAKNGIIRITYDPSVPNPDLEVWWRTGIKSEDRNVGHFLLTYEEKEFYASEYDKCFGTSPRSDES